MGTLALNDTEDKTTWDTNPQMQEDTRSSHKRTLPDESEKAEMTSGPSAELMRTAVHKWMGVRRGSSMASVMVRSMKLNAPLRKYGLQVGTIRFTVDSWWLSDEAADEKRKERDPQSVLDNTV